MKISTSWLVTAMLGLPLVASAQADPADAVKAGPALRYPFAFADYQPWQDLQPGDWRALNDALANTAPRAHAPHEEVAPAGMPAQPASSAPAPAAHDGHRLPGGGS